MGQKRGSYRLLSPTERRAVVALMEAGERTEEVVRLFGSSKKTVRRIWNDAVLSRRRVDQSAHRLSFPDREEISRMLVAGLSFRAIGRELGRAASTISREVNANGGRKNYRAISAERRAQRLAGRPRATKLSACEALVRVLEWALEQRWSPQQISAWLKGMFVDDQEMHLSHETIYRSLYVQARGELHRRLTGYLRMGRSTRKSQARTTQRGRIADQVNISERPAEVQDRAVPGHWEGDLILGTGCRSAVLTLVERQTRFVMLAYLGDQHTTERVTAALAARIQDLPAHLKQSVTWDQGKEMTAHRQFTVDTGVQVYFCDPRSPWQRGSNENTNGLLRQYLPKGTDLSVHDQAALDRIAWELNGRPRETLGWSNPAWKMIELIDTGAVTIG